MTSNINYTSINAAFPIAGQDNDSQGFRDNFGVIKTALTTASNEISDLQLNTAKTNEANNFNGNVVYGAKLKYNSEVVVGHTVTPGTLDAGVFTLNYFGGNYRTISISTNTTFQVSNWPVGTAQDGNLGKMRLEIVPTTSSAVAITFSSPAVGGVIKAQRQFPYTSTNTYSQLWDIWTYDNGANTFVQFVGTWTTVTT
jgi:hypothetical protein